MRFPVQVPNIAVEVDSRADFADLHLVAELAHEAEDAGWDGLFVWATSMPIGR
jgi:N-acetylglutamate synthase-like GNAT family acetyltransferase